MFEFMIIIFGSVTENYYSYEEEDGYKYVRYVLTDFNNIGIPYWGLS